MKLKDQLLIVVDAYVKAVGRSEGRVSTVFFGSGKALKQLRDGRDMGSERIGRALQDLSDKWPTGVTWPQSVDRPKPKTAENPQGAVP